jgi:uncharacterized HAD superfamily protein
MGKKIFIIDIDGTVCEDIKNEEGQDRMAKAKPYEDVIRQINRWHKGGNFICFFTARTLDHKTVTEAWLKQNGAEYDQIIYGKPRRIGDYTEYHFIDNAKIRATTYTGKIGDFITRTREILVFPGE